MDAKTQTVNLIGKLLSAFPPPSFGGSKEDALRRYIEALEGYAVPDIVAGIDLLVKGRFPGVDGRFAPTPPQVSSAVRRAMEDRIDSERRSRPPRLMKPDVPLPTPEEKARAKAALDAFMAQHRAPKMGDEAKKAEEWSKVHARFDAPQDPESLSKRLLKGVSYMVGNDADEEAA